MAYGYMHGAGQSSRVTQDAETESIVFTTTYADRTDVKRIHYKEISSIELDRNASPLHYQITVIDSHNERYTFAQSNAPLEVEASKLAESTGRPLVVKDDSPAGALKKDRQ